jgi:hypothetical protein
MNFGDLTPYFNDALHRVWYEFPMYLGYFEYVSSKFITKINKEKSHEQNMDESEKGKQTPQLSL